MLLALSVTTGAVVFAALLLFSLFRFIDPAIVRDDYRPCAGNWYEAQLHACEAGLAAVPQQPVNTYTNLAYPAAGLFPGVLLDTPTSYVFAFTMTYLCIGSALYHATSTHWAGMLDVTAIYVVFSTLAAFAAAVVLGLPDWLIPGLMFVAAGVVAYIFTPRFRRRMNVVIGGFLGAAYVLVVLRMWLTSNWMPWPYLALSLASFALAFIFWRMDLTRTFPLRRWGHGLWHLLTAAASGLIFYTIEGVRF